MKGLRGERLASQFREEIYRVIATKLRNRYSSLSAIISVTQVDVAPDLKTAKVYVSIYDPDTARKDASFKILKENAGFIRHELSQVLHLRTVPELSFILDGSMEYGAKIDKIIESLENQENKDD
ncbi:MAG TPA: 30S ribosome-binding factor RbfA [Candidatus Coproplasma excrementipullorum]|nr:30S ribosome-binding factor RbfA [Candidatus Coproplasma excrementipullorum]